MEAGAIAVAITGVRFGHSTARRRGAWRPPPREDPAQARHALAGGFDNRTIGSPASDSIKGSFARVSTIRLAIVVRQRFFGIPATDTDIISAQHCWTGGLETAGPAGYEPASVMRRLSLNRSEPAKKERPKYPEKSLPDNNT